MASIGGAMNRLIPSYRPDMPPIRNDKQRASMM
jgi:hypothetical protein